MWGKMGVGEMEGDRGMVMEVEGARKLGRKGMLSCRRGGYWDVNFCIGVSGSGGVGSNVGVDVTDGTGSGGGCWQWLWRQ